MVEDPKTKEPVEPTEPPKLSVLEETKKAIEEFKKERKEFSKIRDELQSLKSDNLLSGTAGGHVEPVVVSEAEKSKQGAKEFFKGTALEDAIDKL